MSSCISSIGTANPSHMLKQESVYQFMANAFGVDKHDLRRLKSIYEHSGIDYRYSVIPDFSESNVENFKFFASSPTLEPFVNTKTRLQTYQREAIKIAENAVRNCFAGLPDNLPKLITHLITVSCTGMYAPGLDIDLIERLCLQSTVERTGINFMGCYGAINGLKVANYICTADPNAKVLLVSVELCTLHFQKHNTLDNWVSNSLFSDGAAAVLIENTLNRITTGICLTLAHFYNEILPIGRDDMGWYVGNTGFEMILSSRVSKHIRNNISLLTERLLKSGGLSDLNCIDHFAIHPGGRKILEAVEDALGLPKESNRYAYQVLSQYGNMSSATILFVLQKILKNALMQDQQILGFGFGPGLTAEGMLLKAHL